MCIRDRLHTAAQAEYYSTHPIGLSILLAAGEIEAEEIKSYQEVAGKGVSAVSYTHLDVYKRQA